MRRMIVLVMLAAALVGQVWNVQAAEGNPWKVFVLAGQSNMGGKAKMSLLEYQANAPETAEEFAFLKNGDTWKVRDDVYIKFRDRKGGLTVGYGYKNCIGSDYSYHYLGSVKTYLAIGRALASGAIELNEEH